MDHVEIAEASCKRIVHFESPRVYEWKVSEVEENLTKSSRVKIIWLPQGQIAQSRRNPSNGGIYGIWDIHSWAELAMLEKHTLDPLKDSDMVHISTDTRFILSKLMPTTADWHLHLPNHALRLSLWIYVDVSPGNRHSSDSNAGYSVFVYKIVIDAPCLGQMMSWTGLMKLQTISL